MDKILQLLENDARLTPKQLAVMLDMPESEVKEKIAQYEAEGIIAGYRTIINRDKISDDDWNVALIGLRVTPQLGEGFDKIADRICAYPQVSSVYLVSGDFDLTVVIEGKSMKEVALFVAERLAPMEGVLSTFTHFILRNYKEKGIKCYTGPKDERGTVVL